MEEVENRVHDFVKSLWSQLPPLVSRVMLHMVGDLTHAVFILIK